MVPLGVDTDLFNLNPPYIHNGAGRGASAPGNWTAVLSLFVGGSLHRRDRILIDAYLMAFTIWTM